MRFLCSSLGELARMRVIFLQRNAGGRVLLQYHTHIHIYVYVYDIKAGFTGTRARYK